MPREKMWFGTQHHSEWITPPLSGADMSPQSWGVEGTYLSGGGFVRQAQDSHRQYIFEWAGSSSREAAETLQAYRDGVYSLRSTDLIYFQDPNMYSRNVLPKRWAQPGIVAPEGRVSPSPLGNVQQVSTPAAFAATGVPLAGASVESRTLGSLNALTRPALGVVWVPVPEGMTLRLVSWTDTPSGSNGLYARALGTNGSWSSAVKIGSSPTSIPNSRGVLLGTVGSFEFYGARAVLETPDDWNWLPGTGNSGCRFVGNPTWVAVSGVHGGQIGYAATLKEIGDWQ